jgi:hypothetical protein
MKKPYEKAGAALIRLARAVLAGEPELVAGEPTPLNPSRARKAWEAFLLRPEEQMSSVPPTLRGVATTAQEALAALVELAEGQGLWPARLRARLCQAIRSELEDLVREWEMLQGSEPDW